MTATAHEQEDPQHTTAGTPAEPPAPAPDSCAGLGEHAGSRSSVPLPPPHRYADDATVARIGAKQATRWRDALDALADQ